MDTNRLRTRDIFAAVVVAMLLGAGAMALLPQGGFLAPSVVSNFGSIVQYVAMLVLAAHVASRAGLPRKRIFGQPLSLRFLPPAAWYGLLLLCFTAGENFVEVYATAQRAPAFAYAFWNFHAATYDLQVPLAGYASIAIAQFALGPLVEEFVFRGLLLRAWAARWGLPAAIVASSALFAAMHYSRHYYASTLVFGVAMCLLYLRYHSLWMNAFVHGLSNLGAFLLQFAFDFHWHKAPGELAQLSSWKPEIAMLAISAPLLTWFIAKSWPSRDPVSGSRAFPDLGQS